MRTLPTLAILLLAGAVAPASGSQTRPAPVTFIRADEVTAGFAKGAVLLAQPGANYKEVPGPLLYYVVKVR